MSNPPNRDQLDTGVGGFVIPPEEAPSGADGIYSYDVGDPDRPPSPDYPIRDRSLHGGNVSVDHSTKDLSKTTRLTLGHYIGKKTAGVNRYPVDIPESQDNVAEIKVTRLSTGTTPKIQPSPNRAQHGRGRDIEGVSTSWRPPVDGPQGYSDSVVYPDPSLVGFAPGLTESPSSGYYSGNELLVDDTDNSPAQVYSRAILNNNRFTPEIKSFEGDEHADPSFPGDKFDAPVGAPPVSSPRFGALGLGTRASIGGYLLDGARGGISKEGSPGVPPRINMDDIDITKFLSLGVDDLPVNLTSIRETSRGVLLDHNNTWSSFGNVLKEDTWSVILPAVIIGAAGVVTSFVQYTNKGPSTNINFRADAKTTETLGDMTYGSSFSAAGDSQLSSYITSTFGLKRTYFLYTDAVAAGVLMYSLQRFIPTADRLFDGFKEGFMKGLAGTPEIFSLLSDQSMGQVKILAKKILIQYESFRNNISSIEFGLNAIQQYTDIISGSGLINTLNVFATMGDAILNQWPNFLTGAYSDLEKSGDYDTEYYALGGRRGGYGWSVQNSAHILLGQIDKKKTETKLLTSDPSKKDKIKATSDKVMGITDGRIPPEDAFEIEQALESEYVPFYFLDTRTNEIISFHAFLDSLNESYSPQIDSIDALGRAEPIKIYKGVQRKVSLSFYVVSLNMTDFEYMWTKMNKLLTLVYPQYTAGRMLSATNDAGETFNFRQPFSQIMSASPLIRLRVGNLIRSNYTERAMQDQFGAFDADTFLPQIPEISTPAAVEQTTVKKQLGDGKHILFTVDSYVVRESEKATIGKIVDEIISLINGGKKITKLIFVGYASKEGDTEYNQKLSEHRVNETSWVFTKLWYEKASTQKWYNKAPVVAFNDSQKKTAQKLGIDHENWRIPFGTVYDSKGETDKFDTSSLTQNRRVTFFAEYEEKSQVDDAQVRSSDTSSPYISADRVDQTDIDVSKLSKRYLDLTKNGFIKQGTLFDFLSPKNNSIIKTFQDSGAGGGLAGFIESLTLDWVNNQTTWDTTSGKKAPKMCKITMDFSPIHDIAPGLNHNGYNRAPIYNFSAPGGRDPDLAGFGDESVLNAARVENLKKDLTTPEPAPPAPAEPPSPAAAPAEAPTPPPEATPRRTQKRGGPKKRADVEAPDPNTPGTKTINVEAPDPNTPNQSRVRSLYWPEEQPSKSFWNSTAPKQADESIFGSKLERAAYFNEAEEERAVAEGRFIKKWVSYDPQTDSLTVRLVNINPVELRYGRQTRRQGGNL